MRLRDVAELAGVSVKTASNVINNYPHIKPSTRERVEAAIAELRYRPNESARQTQARPIRIPGAGRAADGRAVFRRAGLPAER